MNSNKISILFLPSGQENLNLDTKRLLEQQNNIDITEGNIGDAVMQYNEFVRNAVGKYITVVNGGDTFSVHYFTNVFRQLEKYGDGISLVMTDKEYYFDGQKQRRVFLPDYLPEEETVVNLWEREDCAIIPVFLNGTIIRREVAKQYLMNPIFGMEAEKEMLLHMSLENRTFLYLQSECYNYYTPRDVHHYIFPGVYQKEWYYDSFSKFFRPFLTSVKEIYGRIPHYLQYVTAHYIVCRILANENTYDKKVITEDGKTYLRSFQTLLQYVDDEILADCYHCPAYTSSIYIRLLLARLKYDDEKLWLDYCHEDAKTIDKFVHQGAQKKPADSILVGKLYGVPFFDSTEVTMQIQFMEYQGEKLEMDLKSVSFFEIGRVEYYAEINGKRYDLNEEMRYSHCKFFDETVYKYHTFHVSVPVKRTSKEQNLTFWMKQKGNSYQLGISLIPYFSRIPNQSVYGYWKFQDYIAFRKKGNTIVIRPARIGYLCYRELRTWMEWLKRRTSEGRYFVLLRILYFLTRPYFRKKTIWMFYDKIYKGGDSAEYLYKYCENQKDNIKTYYLLDKHSADYQRMKKEGYRPMKRGSLLHKLIFLNADMMIVSNSTVFAFNGYLGNMAGYIKDLIHFHVVCVQHGLSVQNIARAQHRLRDNTRLYFCASKYEIENLSRPVYNYVGYDVLRLTGVPRYDGLVNEAKKQILISPTWRMQSAMIVMGNEGVERDYNPYFKQTDYYHIYNRLINDPKLIEAAKKYGYRIVYVLHPIVSPQADDFEKNDYVEIIPSVGDMSYEKLFRESALMVTDYSGVQFDFAYMRKPVIYLHHKDIPKHYDEGVFAYDTMAFGEICTTNEELIEMVVSYMRTGCKMKYKYLTRTDDFFAFRDYNNCKRIYKEMIQYQYNVVNQLK